MAELPGTIREFLREGVHAQFATVSSAGLPVDTPMMYFPSEGMRTFDVATGLAYPSKAERARRNPKVGLLIEGTPDEPVVSIAGWATVRDTDLQANADLYMAETAFNRLGAAPWPLARNAVWYWTRMIVSIAPVRILWWDSPAETDGQPHIWEASDTDFPPSDPVPPGRLSSAPKWPETPWEEQARKSLAGNLPGHLTLCDSEGYPLPIKVRSIRQTANGFEFEIPKGAPWTPEGIATLTFAGLATFVGEVEQTADGARLLVTRALPVLPFMASPTELWEPGPETRSAVMARLEHEVGRRNRPIPRIPDDEPEPSAGARLRIARLARLKQPLQSEKLQKARSSS